MKIEEMYFFKMTKYPQQSEFQAFPSISFKQKFQRKIGTDPASTAPSTLLLQKSVVNGPAFYHLHLDARLGSAVRIRIVTCAYHNLDGSTPTAFSPELNL